MQRPPRAVDRPIVTGFGIWRIVFVGLALLAYTLCGLLLDEVPGRLGRSSRARSRSTRSRSARCSTSSTAATSWTRRSPSRRIWATSTCRSASARSWVLQLLFTYAPPFQAMFEQPGDPAWRLACSCGRAGVFRRRGGGKARHPLVRCVAEHRDRSGGRDVKLFTVTD